MPFHFYYPGTQNLGKTHLLARTVAFDKRELARNVERAGLAGVQGTGSWKMPHLEPTLLILTGKAKMGPERCAQAVCARQDLRGQKNPDRREESLQWGWASSSHPVDQ